MAKTQIKNYVFKPGIGSVDNLYPNAYDLLESNKPFIQKESTAWIQQQINNSGQFTPTAASYNPTTGIMTLTIGSHNLQVGDVVRIAANSLTFTCALDNNATTHTYPRSSGVPNPSGTDPTYNAPIFIISRTNNSITLNVGISSDTSTHTFVSATSNAVTGGFPGYTYNSSKCERDVGFVIDAYLNDLRYGGNEKVKNTIKYYWDQDVAQVDGDRFPEIATHTFIGTLITDYIFTNTLYTASNTEVAQTRDLTKTVQNYQFTPSAASYTPSTGTMTLTIGTHTLTAGTEIFIAPNSLTFTCALDGHSTLHTYPRGSGVPNDTGKDPYYYAPVIITEVTSTTITVNIGISSDTSTHTFVSALTNSVTSGAFAKIDTLVFNTVDVITNGLSAQPTLVRSGVGTIKVQGRYNLSEFLLITNATKNEIIYNFSNPGTGGSIVWKTDGIEIDSNFPAFLQTTDAVTTLTLNYNTNNHSASDELQIFVEQVENGKSVTTTRPYDFGTDSIERMRVAMPLSMLDADFEYGLQPTKWAAIGTLRGYPSVYEVPGTDTPVSTVTTDASTGTAGVGQSLITVTTVGPHGFEEGEPITIKALEDSVTGAARAEGSFVINTVPTNNTFTFYAKSKVGTSNGQVLSTTYTQLRKAAFYTGANIGKPEIDVVSNGFSGTLVAELDVPAGENRIPFDGPSPEVGAPLVDTTNNRLPLGAQVSGVVDQSAGGGVYITPIVEGDYPSGTSIIDVFDSTGIVENLAADSGDGTAIFIENISGNQLTFSNSFNEPVIGNRTSYSNVSGTNDSTLGTNATFNISRSGGVYTVDSIANDGQDYEIGDRLSISANLVGGISPDNDLVLIVNSLTDTDNAIGSVTVEGTAFDGTYTFTGLTPDTNGGIGVNARFDVTYTNNSFTSVTINNAGTGYIQNDRIKINGSAFAPIGVDITNDLIIRVTGVDGSGGVTTFTSSGTAPNGYAEYTSPTFTYGGSGINADFTVERIGTTYDVNFTNQGTGYSPTETITVAGTQLGGTSPTNDLIITIDNVGGSGQITDFSLSGLAVNTGSNTLLNTQQILGTGLTLDVGLSAGVYSVTVTSGGVDYGQGQTITILGTSLIGTTPTNDLSITISTVDALGTVLTTSSSGTAASGTGTHLNVPTTLELPIGSGASFDILRNNSTYSVSINLAGTNYKIGNRILLLGTQLGGSSPLNDILIRVTGASTGQITSINSSYVEASAGINLDLYSVILSTELSTGLISRGSLITYEALATLEITFASAHGLVPGSTFIVTVISDDGINNHALAAGSFFATDIPTVTKLRYQARAAGLVDTDGGADPINATVYPRPDSFFIHRPYDGGVQLGTGGPQHGAQAIRQSKKYIRYQSGKGIMYTTGALFAPSYDLRSVTASGVEVNSVITVVTDDNDHGVQEGGIIRLLGIETPGYNSGPETATPPTFDYTVTNVIDERTFQIRSQRRLGATTAVLGFGAQMSVVSWHGATVRSGIFDDQNGIFWEFDGTQISVVQRTGTRQLAGTTAMTVDNNLVTGTNTRFLDQLKAGDRIIVKGMTHVVSHVNSQTECTVTPDWRGVVDITGAKANLIVDKKVKQSEFNLDRLDGTGPSGYDIDIAKMQMIGIQYSWYGAGFIDFMLRGSDGNFTFAHRMRNSNVNTEAFMRSGNLPVRYEVTNEGPSGKLAEGMNASQNYLVLDDTSFFPTSGYVYIDNEIMRFTGKNNNTNRLTGLTRSATFQNFQAGANRNYTAGAATTHNARTGVILISQTITPLISHWGSAFLTDGGFDEDRGYIFSYAETNISVSTTKQTAFMIRLAPSVSNAIVGDLGERELLNRAQLLLQGLEITSDGSNGAGVPYTGGIVVEGVLNPQNYPLNPSDVGWSELSGVAQGGQPSFAQVAAGGSVVWTTGVSATTATATAIADISVQLDSGLFQTRNNDSFVYVSATDYRTTFNTNNISAVTGKTITGTGIPANTTITGGYIDPNSSSNYGYFNISNRTTQTINAGISNAFTVTQPGSLTDRNFAYLTTASFDATGANIGTAVTGGSVVFPANTLINNISQRSFGGTNYYEVQFNNTFSGTLAQNTGTVQFSFTQPPYGQPGETVFSFIATPGERSTLDLSELKELTNTPLGGRGTYPNGPDVLAINVYKVSGSAVPANIILRWGEAQA